MVSSAFGCLGALQKQRPDGFMRSAEVAFAGCGRSVFGYLPFEEPLREFFFVYGLGALIGFVTRLECV